MNEIKDHDDNAIKIKSSDEESLSNIEESYDLIDDYNYRITKARNENIIIMWVRATRQMKK